MRNPFYRHPPEETWKTNDYIWLENVSDKNLRLPLRTGNVRLDVHRKLRFRSDVLDQPPVKALVDAGQLAVRGLRE